MNRTNTNPAGGISAAAQPVPSSQDFAIRPFDAPLGAEIAGADFRLPLDAASAARLRQALVDHLVLVARGNDLAAEDQIRFCRYFGELSERAAPREKRYEPEDAPGGSMYVSNLKQNGRNIGSLPDGELQFHSDQSYIECPAMGTSLYAIEVPDEGGDTLFANMYEAYRTLPDALKQRLDGARAVRSYSYDSPVRGNVREDAVGFRRFAHPVFRTHPDSGRKSLYVDRLMTESIEGFPPEESRKLLETLCTHAERPEFIYRHHWLPGDLLIWDNRCTLHARMDFDPSKRRHLRRFTLRGTRPF